MKGDFTSYLITLGFISVWYTHKDSMMGYEIQQLIVLEPLQHKVCKSQHEDGGISVQRAPSVC